MCVPKLETTEMQRKRKHCTVSAVKQTHTSSEICRHHHIRWDSGPRCRPLVPQLHQRHLQEGDSISPVDHSGVEAQGWGRDGTVCSSDSEEKTLLRSDSVAVRDLCLRLCGGFGSGLRTLLCFLLLQLL